jgi:hypothetical protein
MDFWLGAYSAVFWGVLIWLFVRGQRQGKRPRLPLMAWVPILFLSQSASAREEMESMRKAEHGMRVKEFLKHADDLRFGRPAQ